MFAIVKLGNQQFKVKAGDFIRVPYQKASPGEEIEVPVLGFGDEKQFVFSAEQLKKSKVKAVLLRQSLSKKVLVFKKKRRKGYRRTKGHRQKISELKVLELCSPDGKVSKMELKKSEFKKAGDKKTNQKKTSSGKTITDKKDQAKKTSNRAKPSHKKVKKASRLKNPEKKITKKKGTSKKASDLKSKDKKLNRKKSSRKSAKSPITNKTDTKKSDSKK